MSDSFDQLAIDDNSWLDEVDSRVTCHKCQRSRKYYCYSCFVPVGGIDDRLPKVHLPLKIDIIKHPNETEGKSTAAHAAILAADHVTVYTYPCIPQYRDKDKVLLVFPGDQSLTLGELKDKLLALNQSIGNEEQHSGSHTCINDVKYSSKCLSEVDENCAASTKCSDSSLNQAAETVVDDDSQKESNRLHSKDQNKETKVLPSSPYHTVVFIDSTWAQTKKIYKDERLQGLVQVELKSQVTKFWRHQNDKPDTYLATIEAIYYFLLEYHQMVIDLKYTGQYDNLLFFFSYMYKKLRTLYGGDKKRKKIDQKGSGRKKNKSDIANSL